MSETAPEPGSESRARSRPELTRWKKVLLAGAAVFLVVGACLEAFGSSGTSEPDAAADAESPSDPEPGVAPDTLTGDDSPKIEWPPSTDEPPEAEPTAEEGPAGWSPFFLKGGFSFVVAFCVGYAMRVWLKLAALFLGTFLLGVFLLSYAGALDPDWAELEGWWNALAAHVEAQAADFKTFLTGSLPQAGLAGLGLVAGFKRR